MGCFCDKTEGKNTKLFGVYDLRGRNQDLLQNNSFPLISENFWNFLLLEVHFLRGVKKRMLQKWRQQPHSLKEVRGCDLQDSLTSIF